jgi:hypothetical protein
VVGKGNHGWSHFLWALLRTSNVAGQDPRGDGNNCIMPSSTFRFDAIDQSGVFAGIQPYGLVELLNGTVSVLGRVAGICKLDTYLGSFREGKERKTIQDIVTKVRGDVEIVSRVFKAMSASVLDAAKISDRANRVYHGDVTTC